MKNTLPIEAVLEDIRRSLLTKQNLVVSAEPGAGKTTLVPLALVNEPWMDKRRLVMLEPRRLAARRSAEFMSSLLGERVGQTVGYRIRGESVVGPATRIEVVTEGVLTRILHDQPDLPGVALVIFDEFHERSIHADLGLAFALDVQSALREDLRLLVMSATLDHVAVSSLMNESPVITCPGRMFDVVTKFDEEEDNRLLGPRVRDAILRALRNEVGDLLVFLPGQSEIRWIERLLDDAALPEEVLVCALYGEAPVERQRQALDSASGGRRKVILSTSIAETSLTVEGVRVVLDAGLSRLSRFDPRRGMSGLVTVPVSKASADQRRGRAGRLASGVCYRLWTAERQRSLPEFTPPEILTADLAPLAIDLAKWGDPSGEHLHFLDHPPLAHLSQARTLLRELGALDASGKLTDHGRTMASLPVHPRVAHMMIRGMEIGGGSEVYQLAALLGEPDVLRGEKGRDADLLPRLRLVQENGNIDKGTRARLLAEATRLSRLVGAPPSTKRSGVEPGLLLALAYPERIARKRDDASGRYQLASGTGAVLPKGSILSGEEFLAIAEVDGAGTEALIRLAAPVMREDIEKVGEGMIEEEREVQWDGREEAVVAVRVRRYGMIPLERKAFVPTPDEARSAMIEGIRMLGCSALPWDKSTSAFRNRSEWVLRRGLVGADWPDLRDEALMRDPTAWLGPFLDGVTRRQHLARLDLSAILRSMYTYAQRRELDRLAPETLTVPTGSSIRVDYATGEDPILPVKLQELFGQISTPLVGGGKVPVLIHLLSPAGRPLGITRDLASFWKNAYPDVRKEMRGRYPKHPWPEDPLAATPTRRAKQRRAENRE